VAHRRVVEVVRPGLEVEDLAPLRTTHLEAEADGARHCGPWRTMRVEGGARGAARKVLRAVTVRQTVTSLVLSAQPGLPRVPAEAFGADPCVEVEKVERGDFEWGWGGGAACLTALLTFVHALLASVISTPMSAF